MEDQSSNRERPAAPQDRPLILKGQMLPLAADVDGAVDTVAIRADVIVLDRDPRQVPTSELPNVKVDFVFVDGRQVYAREGAAPALTKEVMG